MKKKAITVLALLLALCCILTGCSKTASDTEAFGEREPAQQGESETENNDAESNEKEQPDNVEDIGAEATEPPATEPVESGPFIDKVSMGENVEIAEEVIPLSTSPAAVPNMLLPAASGTAVAQGYGAEIDYSNVQDGYVMARFQAANDKRLRVQVIGPTTTYTYDLPTGSAWSTFPLSDGSGTYKVTVLQNTTGKKYAVLTSASFPATLKDEFAPFLRPNQYVNYEGASNTIAMAAQLTSDVEAPLEKVGKVYNYVVKNLSYDQARAAAVSSGQLVGYLPNLDSVLAEKKGICFDYAALMTGMLRSQGIPCKLVVGYAGTTYHAWVSVWTRETGWVDNAIYFDGTTWHRMDPTFASSGNSSDYIMQYIGNGGNYTVKFLY